MVPHHCFTLFVLFCFFVQCKDEDNDTGLAQTKNRVVKTAYLADLVEVMSPRLSLEEKDNVFPKYLRHVLP